MNVLDTLDKELKNKSLTELQKLRYLYIRCCQLFYFDSRYAFKDIWKDNIEEEIKNSKIDLTDVKDFRVICHTYAPNVLIPVIKEFTNLEPIHVGRGRNHSIVVINGLGGEQWRLDGTASDLSRTKMNLYPTGMTGNISNSATKSFRKIDKVLGFEFLTDQDYVNMTNSSDPREEFRTIGFLLSDNESANKGFSESNYFVNICTSYRYCNSSYSDSDYNFHKIIVVKNGKLYYDLSKDEESYSLKEIDQDRYKYLTKNLKGKSK